MGACERCGTWSSACISLAVGTCSRIKLNKQCSQLREYVKGGRWENTKWKVFWLCFSIATYTEEDKEQNQSWEVLSILTSLKSVWDGYNFSLTELVVIPSTSEQVEASPIAVHFWSVAVVVGVWSDHHDLFHHKSFGGISLLAGSIPEVTTEPHFLY